MGHDARQLDAGRVVQDARDVEQAGQLGIGQAGAAAAAVDLDEDREGVAVRRRLGDRPGDGEIVGDDPQIDAAAAQLGDRRQLGGHDADAVEDVLEAALGEIACFGERRDGDAAVMALDRHAADLDRLRGLEVRPQHDAGLAQAVAHALEVAAQDRPVENEGGRRQVVDCLGGHGDDSSMPIENERKFVLKDDGELEQQLAQGAGRHAQLPAPGLSRRLGHAHPLHRGGRQEASRLHLQARRSTARWSRSRPTSARPTSSGCGRSGARRCRRRATRGPTAASTGTSISSRPTTAAPTLPWPKSRCRKTTARAAAAAAAPGRPSAGAGAGRRSALHLQAAGRPGACREAAGRHPQEGKDRVKIARIDSIRSRCRSPSAAVTGRGPAHLDDQQHPAGEGRDRHRHHRLGRGVLLRLHRCRARGPAQHGRAARDRPRCARHRQALATTCSRSCTCSAATASRSSPCRGSTSRCGTSPARRPTCRCIACWAAPARPACRPMPAC